MYELQKKEHVPNEVMSTTTTVVRNEVMSSTTTSVVDQQAFTSKDVVIGGEAILKLQNMRNRRCNEV